MFFSTNTVQNFVVLYRQKIRITASDNEESINPLQDKKPWFLHVCITSLLKTLWEKEKLFLMCNFSFSHSVFYAYGELSATFTKFLNCHLQTLLVWKSLNFVVWKRINTMSDWPD